MFDGNRSQEIHGKFNINRTDIDLESKSGCKKPKHKDPRIHLNSSYNFSTGIKSMISYNNIKQNDRKKECVKNNKIMTQREDSFQNMKVNLVKQRQKHVQLDHNSYVQGNKAGLSTSLNTTKSVNSK